MGLTFKTRLFANWKFILVILIPLILLPIVFVHDDDVIKGSQPPIQSTKFKAAYVIIMMALFWMLEVIPLPVTALLPVVFFPLFGILSTGSVTVAYMKETNMMFTGGLIIALSIEYCNLHRRIALWFLLLVGASPIRLVAGIMLISMILSMWINNTACCAMMVPIVLAVLDELSKTPEHNQSEELRATEASDISNELKPNYETFDTENAIANGSTNYIVDDSEIVKDNRISNRLRTKKMLLFATAYACNIGGTGVLTGTVPNLILQGKLKELNVGQDGKYVDLTFLTWMGFNVVPMLVNVILAFIYLVWFYFGIPNWHYWPIVSCFTKREAETLEEKQEEAKTKIVHELLSTEYKKLGSMTFHEIGIGILFLLVIFFFLFRDPRFISGWKEVVPNVDVGDSTAAILVIFLMFIIPRNLSFIFGTPGPGEKNEALLDWGYIQRNMPWGVIILLGGGSALSDGSDKSGLSDWVGDQMNGLKDLPNELILLIVMVLTALITEVASNVACANVIIPILISLSRSIKIHPLYITMAATVCCSYAFMLPVATPPNAIIYAAGDISILDMVKTGAGVNVLCTVVFFLLNISYGNLIFDYGNYEYATE